MKNSGQEVLSNRIYNKKWADNSSKSAEATILLELVQVIVKKSKHIQHRKIIIALDCYEVYWRIVKKIMKTICIVGDRGGEIAAIRDAISNAIIEIEFQLK